jgi:hypothetical protein
MRRVQLERPKPKKERAPDPLPIDPRDPEVLRAKMLLYARRPRRR